MESKESGCAGVGARRGERPLEGLGEGGESGAALAAKPSVLVEEASIVVEQSRYLVSLEVWIMTDYPTAHWRRLQCLVRKLRPRFSGGVAKWSTVVILDSNLDGLPNKGQALRPCGEAVAD